MDGSKEIRLSNGDALILLDGQYFISYGGDKQPVGIEREDGEQRIFETCWQLGTVLETLAPMVKRYEKALEEIAKETGTPYAKIARKALIS